MKKTDKIIWAFAIVFVLNFTIVPWNINCLDKEVASWAISEGKGTRYGFIFKVPKTPSEIREQIWSQDCGYHKIDRSRIWYQALSIVALFGAYYLTVIRPEERKNG